MRGDLPEALLRCGISVTPPVSVMQPFVAIVDRNAFIGRALKRLARSEPGKQRQGIQLRDLLLQELLIIQCE